MIFPLTGFHPLDLRTPILQDPIDNQWADKIRASILPPILPPVALFLAALQKSKEEQRAELESIVRKSVASAEASLASAFSYTVSSIVDRCLLAAPVLAALVSDAVVKSSHSPLLEPPCKIHSSGPILSSRVITVYRDPHLYMQGRVGILGIGRRLTPDDVNKEVVRCAPFRYSIDSALDWSRVPSLPTEEDAKHVATKIIAATPSVITCVEGDYGNDEDWLTVEEYISVINKISLDALPQCFPSCCSILRKESEDPIVNVPPPAYDPVSAPAHLTHVSPPPYAPRPAEEAVKKDAQ